MGSSKQKRACLEWKTRDDQSLWAACEIGGHLTVVAVIVDNHGEVSATAFVELFRSSPPVSVDAAQTAVENWLTELGAKQIATGLPYGSPARPKK